MLYVGRISVDLNPTSMIFSEYSDFLPHQKGLKPVRGMIYRATSPLVIDNYYVLPSLNKVCIVIYLGD